VNIGGRYPSEGLPEFQCEFAGQPLSVEVRLGGYRFTLINAGGEYRVNAAISFIVNVDPLRFGGDEGRARAALDALWDGLAAGGEVVSPLGETFFSKRYGFLHDRFGIGWQLSLTNPEGDARPFIVPALTFSAAAQNRAAEAVEHYLDVLPGGVLGDGERGRRVTFGSMAHPPATGESIAYSEFRIGDQWFVAWDAGTDHAANFTPGVSLEIDCDGQDTIDRLWAALSADPAHEQCGWLVDRFGVSWQVVPDNLAELLARPNAPTEMLQMNTIVIADF
jgi:predicted 3-demethylubiquinone-9 3-methyltransferase (glyoxalase superfamily)